MIQKLNFIALKHQSRAAWTGTSPAWWPLRRQWSLSHLVLLHVLLRVLHIKSSKIITTHECQWNCAMLFYILGLYHVRQKKKNCAKSVWTCRWSVRDVHIKNRLRLSSACLQEAKYQHQLGTGIAKCFGDIDEQLTLHVHNRGYFP